VIARIDITKRCGHTALSHDGVCFTQERFADDSGTETGFRTFYCCSESRATCADDKDIMVYGLKL
jgi:hypothetical protein